MCSWNSIGGDEACRVTTVLHEARHMIDTFFLTYFISFNFMVPKTKNKQRDLFIYSKTRVSFTWGAVKLHVYLFVYYIYCLRPQPSKINAILY